MDVLDEDILVTITRAENAAAEEGAETPPDLPMPEARSVFLGGLFVMALLAVCYVAAEIIMPTVLAFILKLVLQPVMRVMAKLRIPRGIAALLIIVLLFGSFFALGSVLAAPAADWVKQLSGSMPRLQQRLSLLTSPLAAAQAVLHHADGLTAAPGPKPLTVTLEGSRLSDRLLQDTRGFITGIFQTILMVFFLLIAGDTFLRRLVELLPRFHDKRQAVAISQQVESDISAYLATITVMNILVGFATGLAMWFFGFPTPVLWGTMAFLLNYIPIIGPIIGIVVFSMVGLLSTADLLSAFLPAGTYALIHLTESMYVTPSLVAKRFTLNPVLVVIALIFWYWMWGVPGAILSTPMLAIAKIICDHVPSLKPLGHFMEGEPKSAAPVAV